MPPLIRTPETLKQKMWLLDVMADVEVAQSIIKESEKDDTHNMCVSMHLLATRAYLLLPSIDSKYSKLKCKIEPVDKSSDEFKQINEFVKNNQEQGRQQLELLELFKYAPLVIMRVL